VYVYTYIAHMFTGCVCVCVCVCVKLMAVVIEGKKFLGREGMLAANEGLLRFCQVRT